MTLPLVVSVSVFVALVVAEWLLSVFVKKPIDYHSRIYNEWWKKGK